MIIEQHYDEEVLIGLLEEAEHDTHVPSCDTCAGTLESLRDLTGALRDDSVWDERVLSESPSPQTSKMLRAFAQRTKVEDAEAATIVPKLIATPSMIQAHPEWRTAGVVRRLLTVVDERNFSDPKLAADLAALAVEVAESLDATQYPHDTVMKLRARAWGERGYALYYIGSYKESLHALDRTDELLSKCSVSDFESADTALHRAQVYGELERLDDAIALANAAEDVFRRFGNARRVLAAKATKATLLMLARRYDEALLVHERISANPTADASSRALAVYHAAMCYREQSQFTQAKGLFAEAMAEFERHGNTAARAKATWSLGTVFALEQHYVEALTLLNQARLEFTELGMAEDVALSSVDAAEALLMLDRPAEVPDLCQSAMEYFANAGLAYTQGALTALAYLKEAAAARTLTPASLRHVRAFFEILPKQPQLLFASPA
jgi:tetratricopeptide (TPR) repeat protein